MNVVVAVDAVGVVVVAVLAGAADVAGVAVVAVVPAVVVAVVAAGVAVAVTETVAEGDVEVAVPAVTVPLTFVRGVVVLDEPRAAPSEVSISPVIGRVGAGLSGVSLAPWSPLA